MDTHAVPGSSGYNPIDNGPTSVNVKADGETQPLLRGEGRAAAKGGNAAAERSVPSGGLCLFQVGGRCVHE